MSTAKAVDLIANDSDAEDDKLIVTGFTQGAHGQVALMGARATYAPTPGFVGLDRFKYVVSDGKGNSSTAAVVVAVTAVAPSCTITITGASSTVIGPPYHLTATASCNIGTPEIQWRHRRIGSFSTFKNFSTDTSADFVTTGSTPGTHQFIARVRSQGTTTTFNSNTLNVTFIAATAPCTAVALDTPADGAVFRPGQAISLHATATCPAGTPQYRFRARTAGAAEWTLLGTGFGGASSSFTPPGNGDWELSAIARSSGSQAPFDVESATADVAIGDAPQAHDDELVVDEDTGGTVNVIANDVDPNGDALTATITVPPEAGTATIASGVVTYTPGPDYHGDDALTYTIDDGHGNTASATLAIAIDAVNDAPVAVGDGLVATEDTGASVDIALNDVDIDGDALTLVEITQPAHGAATFTGTVVSYQPAADYDGPDAFTVTITDGHGGAATSSVSVAVAAVNDPPVAAADAASANEDGGASIDVVANDSDIDGDALAIASITQPAHGTAEIVDAHRVAYAPAANYHGPDSFTYTISDGNGGEATATVVVDVISVNDLPIANADAATLDEDTAVTVDVVANDFDIDGDDLAIASITQPAHGLALVIDAHRVRYVPAPDFHGVDALSYTISDGAGGQATAELALEVTGVNDAPVAAADAATLDEDTAAVIDAVANDSDVEGDALTIASITQPAHGTAEIVDAHRVRYAPAANYHGADSFSYTVADGNGGEGTAAVALTVISVNDAPVAVADAASLDEDTVADVDVAANDSDVDGDAVTVVAVTQPANGSAAIAGGRVRYTPNANFHGADAIDYTIADPSGAQASATLALTVASVNDAPVAAAASVSTFDDTPMTITLAGSDVDGDALSFAIASAPAHGTLGPITANRVRYTPAAGFAGSDAFSFTASDGQLTSAAATVDITVVRSVCGNGVREGVHEECDDGNAVASDGCEASCRLSCGSGTGGDRATVDPASGHCFVAYDGVQHSYQAAAALCAGFGGHLPTIGSAAEDDAASAAVHAGDSPWLGGDDIALEATFRWTTDEAMPYTNFAAGKPDDAGNADCLHYVADGEWSDAACSGGPAQISGTLCEFELATATPAFATGGSGTRGLAVADLNGDGHADVAAANQVSNTVGILLGNGAGGFAMHATYPTGTGPVAVGAGDFDGDGDADLAVVNATANTVKVLLGAPGAAFTAGATIAIAAGATSIAVADFDQDGKLDLAIAASGSVQVLRGDGAGGFTVAPGGISILGLVAGLAIGDFNGDGRVDLALTTPVAVLVVLSTGPGTFGLPISLALSLNNRAVIAADLNADGRLDLAVANGAANVSVWFGTPSGLFGAPSTLTIAATPLGIAAGDFDGDGGSDLVALTSNFATLFHGAAGTFTQAGVPIATGGSGAAAAVAANINGDAAQDLVIANTSTSSAGLVLGGAGGLAGARALVSGTSASSTTAGDFNLDGLTDLAVVDPATSKVYVFLQTPAGALVQSATISTLTNAGPSYAVVADFDGDDKPDLAIANVNFSSVSVALGAGNGTFGAPLNTGVAQAPRRLAVGDFNGDGKPDLAVPASIGNVVTILVNTGGGRFGRAADLAAGTSPFAAVIADFNGDSKRDIAVTNTGEANVRVLRGNGDSTFAAPLVLPVAAAGQGLAAGDLDGDGKLDLAATGTTTNSVSLLAGNGTGGFAAAVSVPVGTQPSSVVAVDLDGDGRTDLVVGNAGSNDATVLHSDGGGGFGFVPFTARVGASVSSVTVADLDHDGHLDTAASSNNPFVTLLFSAR